MGLLDPTGPGPFSLGSNFVPRDRSLPEVLRGRRRFHVSKDLLPLPGKVWDIWTQGPRLVRTGTSSGKTCRSRGVETVSFWEQGHADLSVW